MRRLEKRSKPSRTILIPLDQCSSPQTAQMVVSYSNDRAIRIWNPDPGEEFRVLEGSIDILTFTDFLPDSKMIVFCGRDNMIRLWNLEIGQVHKIFKGHSERVVSMAFSAYVGKSIYGLFIGLFRQWPSCGVVSLQRKCHSLENRCGYFRLLNLSLGWCKSRYNLFCGYVYRRITYRDSEVYTTTGLVIVSTENVGTSQNLSWLCGVKIAGSD